MIQSRVQKILEGIPESVQVVAATKQRNPQEVLEVIDAGIRIIGENYVSEARQKFELIGNRVDWHLIGHLQKNKVKKAVRIFDVIETIDSFELAELVDKECLSAGKIMPIFIEVNIAAESQKSGVMPENISMMVERISRLKNIKLAGLMTMGPVCEDAQFLRPYFKKTRELFEENKPLAGWTYLSMGMSYSYKIAIEEGANIVRLGRVIFEEKTGEQL